MTPLRNILIFHLGALGDFILTWPLALALSRIFPQNRILYITHRQKGLLAQKILRIESADIEAGWHHLYSPDPILPEPSQKLLASAHSIYSFISTPDDQWSQNIHHLNLATRLTTLNPTPPSDWNSHAVHYLLEQLQPTLPLKSAVEQILSTILHRGLAPNRTLSSDILIHPGSGSPDKCWPPESFLHLIQLLKQNHRHVRVLLGEVELERFPTSLINQFSSHAELLTPTTYLDLAQHLSSANLLIANDTGPAHLAASLGVPTLSLFGPTNPSTWKPLGPHTHLLHSNPLSSLPPSTVLTAALQSPWQP